MKRGRREKALRSGGLPNRTFSRYLWSFKTTPHGRAIGAAVVVAGALGSASLMSPIAHVFVAGSAFMALALACGAVWRPRVEVSGEFPDTALAGDETTAYFTVRNRSRLTCRDFGLGLYLLPRGVRQRGEPEASIPPGETASVPVTITTRRRGIYSLGPLRPYTRFPFNLFRTGGKELPLSPIVVLPRYQPLQELAIPAGRRYQPGGVAMMSQVGDAAEYVGNREYRPGDPLKHIDFHSWARLAQPFVREYHEEYVSRLAVVLDTYIPAGERIPAAGHPRLEAGVSLTAAITDALSQGEHLVDVFAAGPDVHVYRTGRQTAPFSHMLEVLAGIEASRSDPFETLAHAVMDELATTSGVIFVFLQWDARREALVRAAAEADCEVRTIVIQRDAAGVRSEGGDEAGFTVLTPAAILDGQVARL